MPAHTVLRQVGIAVKSDGTLLSEVDRDANALADRGAKVAATSRRVVESIGSEIIREAQKVADMAQRRAIVDCT